jgi:hypothetical protein
MNFNTLTQTLNEKSNLSPEDFPTVIGGIDPKTTCLYSSRPCSESEITSGRNLQMLSVVDSSKGNVP